MTIDNRNDAILVKLTAFEDDSDDGVMVCAYYTVAMEQTLKTLRFMQSELMPIIYDGEDYFIKDILVHFGNSITDNMPCIEVIS